MNFTQVTILLTMLLALYGCGTKEVPDVDIEEAILYSSEGQFEFKQNKKKSSLFVASNGDYKAVVSLFPLMRVSYLRIRSINKSIHDTKIIINYESAYSQLNGAEKIKLNIKEISHFNYEITPPASMDYYMRDGDGLHVTRKRQHITSEHKKKVRNETYRYFIPFTINDEGYIIDATFRLEINTTLRFGVPGIP